MTRPHGARRAGFPTSLWLAGALLLASCVLLAWPGRARAEEAASGGKEGEQRRVSTDARDDLFFLGGSHTAWSVKDGKLGCLLASPMRDNGMRTVLGHHVKYGTGMFLVGLPISVPQDSTGEKVTLAAGSRAIAALAHVVARDVVFVDLPRPDLDTVLREIWYSGQIWLTIQGTSLAESGVDARHGVEEYGRVCGGRPAP